MTLRGPATRLTIIVKERRISGTTGRCTPRSCTGHTGPGLPALACFAASRATASPSTSTPPASCRWPKTYLAVVIVDTEERIRGFLPRARRAGHRGAGDASSR